MKPRLASLTLDRFRGATQRVCVEFSDKPITLIFGENGSGKSSIIDGLELVLRGTAGSIVRISGASTGSHLPALNSKPGQIFAEANELLSAGKAYVDAVPEITNCPICAQAVLRPDLLSSIEEKLAGIPGVSVAKTKLDSASAAVKQEISRASDCYTRLLRSAVKLYRILKSLPQEALGAIDLHSASVSPLGQENPTLSQQTIAASKELVGLCRASCAQWQDRAEKVQQRIALVSSIATHHKTLTTSKNEAESFEKLHQHLSAIYNIVKPLRQKFVRKTLDSVSGECDRLYGVMHPNEPLGSVCLDVDESKKASCNLSARFCGKEDIPPQAYYSESHADTLGFALFLALTKRRSVDNSILILDDIFTSVDDGHLLNICNLIADESRQFRQIIFATHSRKIFEWVRSGKLPQNIFGLVELSSNWSLNTGIRARGSKVERTEIERHLAEPFTDRVALAANTRHFLEAMLADMVIELGASCRMKKHGDYGLAEYLSGLISLAKDGWQVTGRANDTRDQAVSTEAPYQLRSKALEFSQDTNIVNKLIHSTDAGVSYTDAEVREFATEVLKLHAYLRCKNCGSLACSRKTNRSCLCGRLRMERVVTPRETVALGP